MDNNQLFTNFAFFDVEIKFIKTLLIRNPVETLMEQKFKRIHKLIVNATAMQIFA